jgi:hypothetical protein
MRWFALLGILTACASCGVASQPESAKTVAAYEVPLPTAQERNEFLSRLRQISRAEGLHLDAADEAELESSARVVPATKMTMHAAIWRGASDDRPEAVIMDQSDHLGLVWIMFSRGDDTALARRFRDRAVHEIFARWPNTLRLPIMPTGAIPLHEDLVRTSTGYTVRPAAAVRYKVIPSH